MEIIGHFLMLSFLSNTIFLSNKILGKAITARQEMTFHAFRCYSVSLSLANEKRTEALCGTSENYLQKQRDELPLFLPHLLCSAV